VRVFAVLLAALALAAPALASEQHPTLGELSGEVMCPVCKTTIDQSTSPVANRIRAFIAARISAGDTKSEIERKLIAQFGPAIIAEPSRHGFGLLAWVLPFVAVGLGAVAVGAVAWRWSRTRPPVTPAGGPPLDPELDRRVDEELARFDA